MILPEGGEGGVRTYRPLSALSLSPLDGGLQRGEIIDVEGVRVHLEEDEKRMRMRRGCESGAKKRNRGECLTAWATSKG